MTTTTTQMSDAEARSRRTSRAMRGELVTPADPTLAKKVAEFLALRQRASAAAAITTGADSLLRAAEAEDREAAAKAIVDGGSAADVGTPATDAAHAKISSAWLEFRALSDAVEQAWDALWPLYRNGAQAEEDAARQAMNERADQIGVLLAEVDDLLRRWREDAARCVHWRNVREHQTLGYSPNAPIGVNGRFVDKARVDSSDVLAEIATVAALLDPPKRRAKPEDDKPEGNDAPKRLR